MFALCRQMRRAAIGSIAHAVGWLPNTKNAPIGISAAAASAASDEILKPKAITSHSAVSASPSGQCSASTMPAPVATPLPPSKRWNTGNTWPRNTATAVAGTTQSAAPTAAPSCCARTTASQPLAPSPISVTSAASLLPVRSTLVAPGLPEP
jgi:hypothetical protein